MKKLILTWKQMSKQNKGMVIIGAMLLLSFASSVLELHIVPIILILSIVAYIAVNNEKKEDEKANDNVSEKPVYLKFGHILMIIGGALGLFALFFFDVASQGIVNFGLMDDRRNLIIVAGVIVIVGAILIPKAK